MWGLFLLLFVVNGLFFGFAAAEQNVKEEEVEALKAQGEGKADLLLRLKEAPGQYAGALPLLVVGLGLCLGAALHPFLRHLPPLGEGICLLVAVVFTASLGILSFRRVGSYQPLPFALRYVRVVWLCSRVLLPFTFFTGFLSRLVAIPFGVSFDQEEAAVTEEEIISMVDEAHEQGVIKESEAEMIANVISFNDTQAHEIMTHRKNVIAFDQETLFHEIVGTMMEEGNSRYPVYDGSLDNILGIVHYKDALTFSVKNSWAKYKKLGELPGLIREATFVPETRSIADLFHSMQVRKAHLAIVVDEYGQTAGIVSMEDILEEIVGDIQDEHDEDETRFRRQKGGTVVIDALTRLDEVEEELGTSFDHPEFETLNGFLTAQLGHIPVLADMDQVVEAAGYRFTILSLGNRTIGKVKAEKLATPEGQDGGGGQDQPPQV